MENRKKMRKKKEKILQIKKKGLNLQLKLK